MKRLIDADELFKEIKAELMDCEEDGGAKMDEVVK